PSSVSLTSADSGVDMIIQMPSNASDLVLDLCEPVPYELEIVSTDLGYVRDMVLNFTLPPNQNYVPGSFELAVPSPALGGTYMTTIDPTALGGNQFEIDLSALNTTLNTEGLVGSKDPDNSVIGVRFQAETDCGYISGSRADFILTAANSCGDPLTPVARNSGRVRIRSGEPTINVAITTESSSLNACSNERTTTGGRLVINSGSITNLDSIKIILPAGVSYVANTYVPGTNAVPGNNPAVVRQESGVTVLVWPFDTNLGQGDVVTFDLDVMAEDVGQACTDYNLRMQAFTSYEEECNGVVCSVGEVSGEGTQAVTIQKADLDFSDIAGDVTLSPSDGMATADFAVEVCNFGFTLDAGSTVTVDIYEDTNGNGTFEEGTDVFLFPLETVTSAPLAPGECLTIIDQATFAASDLCTVIGVLNPDRTCTCSEVPSFTYRPAIHYDFPMAYDVCGGETVMVGPMPIAGYSFEWVSIGGSDISNLTPDDDTPAVFSAPLNNTGAPLTLRYALRALNAPCFTEDTISVTIAPNVMDMVNVNACAGTAYDLPTITDPNASNFVWSADPPLMPGELSLSGGGRYAMVNNVAAGARAYTLTYEIGDGGCAASLAVNLNGQNCGGAVTELGNYVWFDVDEDGQQDAGEPVIPGVVVNLIDANTGTVIATTATDAAGNYLFNNLPAGNYAVEFVPLPGFVFTNNDATTPGTNDANDSDADPTTGITPPLFLPLNEQNYDFDAGFTPDCSLAVEVVTSDCVADGAGGLTREYTINVSWMNNPYTYDFVNDGQDIIDVSFAGSNFTVTATELNGSATLGPVVSNATGPFTATAAFQEATACTATFATEPVVVCAFDLALRKTPSTLMPTPGPYAYGDLLCMDVTVFNQGPQPVTNVQVFDSLPAGMLLDGSNSPGWSNIDPLQLYTFAGPIASGDSAKATVCVTLQMTDGGPDDYTNFAEIASFADSEGNNQSAFDEDSTPDTNFSNDNGGNPNDNTNDEITDDGTNDEDDHDAFQVEIFDLALVKMLDTPPFYAIGDTVSYTISVTNQGNVAAQNINVIDYIPDGFEVLTSSMPPWGTVAALNATTDTTSTTISGPLAPGATTSVMIELQLLGVPGQVTYVNYAEITGAQDTDGNTVADIDSTPDRDPTDDAGGAAMSDADDATDGDGTGNPGGSDASTDEDDHDPAFISIDSVSIGSTVFVDPNNNGLQDPGELGIAGVTLELLLDANGNMMIDPGELTPVAMTMTDANGNYYFGRLLPGNYMVQIPTGNFSSGQPLADFGTSSTPTSTADDDMDSDDNGIQPGGPFGLVTSAVVNVIPTMEITAEGGSGGDQDVANGQADANGNMTVDFGFLPNVAIGSTVFADYNDNGMQDTGEPGVPMVNLVLYYDANNDGAINGAELTTPVATTMTDTNGDYVFVGLAPGNYQVGILPGEFAMGSGLEFLPISSTDITTTGADNQTDGDDNGQQPGGLGTLTLSPLITLTPGMEPQDSGVETGPGSDKDDGFDASGDMTVDFGFVCNVSIDVPSPTVDMCSVRRLDIMSIASIVPSNVNGTWQTSGDGMFLDASGDPVSPARYDTALYYAASTNDLANGEVTLTLTSDTAGVCPPVSEQVLLNILQADCGSFPWNGN
ncbi:MAG: SdrD B-like domain-containing protein, partial [Bacteroidota bacterium]